jgi:hypothetical protein
MATRMNGPLRFCLAGVAIGGLVAFAPVPVARAQWLPPWGGASAGEIERSLEAQGYGLIAPLVRRPGVYLADVRAGPAGYQRLIVDARSGQILERFVAPGRMWGPALAGRDEFGQPLPSVGSPWSPGFSGLPAATPAAKNLTAVQRTSTFRPPSVHMAPRKRRLERSPRRSPSPPNGRQRRSSFGQPRLYRLPRHARRPRRTDQARQRPSRRTRKIRINRKSTPVRPRSTTSREPPRRRRQTRPPSRPTDRR